MTGPKYPEIVVHFDDTTPEMYSLRAKVSYAMARDGRTPQEIIEFQDAMAEVMRRTTPVITDLYEEVYLAATDWVTIHAGLGAHDSGFTERVGKVWHLYRMPELHMARIGREVAPGELLGDDFPTREAALNYAHRS